MNLILPGFPGVWTVVAVISDKGGEPNRTPRGEALSNGFKDDARGTWGVYCPLQVNGLETGAGHCERDNIADYVRNLRRQAQGYALIQALLDCDRDDRLPFLEALTEGLRAGAPLPAFGHVMAEANFWADMASRAERKAYCAACFARLSPADQAGFLSFAGQRVAA